MKKKQIQDLIKSSQTTEERNKSLKNLVKAKQQEADKLKQGYFYKPCFKGIILTK